RDVLRPADAHPLHPGRRRGRGHPARLRREVPRVHRRLPPAHRPVRGPDRPEPDRPAAAPRDRGGGRADAARPRRHRPPAARHRQRLGPARPLVREPAGVQADGAGALHRGSDRHARDARSDPGRDRPLMAIDPTRVRRFAHGSRVPGWDEAADLTKDPAVVPDPATTPVPPHVRAEIEAHMARYPDIRSASIPALHIVQREHGWCSPTAIEEAACVMRLTPAYLAAVATFYDMFQTTPKGPVDVYV